MRIRSGALVLLALLGGTVTALAADPSRKGAGVGARAAPRPVPRASPQASPRGDTLEGALARAYLGSPQLNAFRANVRATDELVPRAAAGSRPRINATGDIGATDISTRRSIPGTATTRGQYASSSDTFIPRGVGLTIDQNIFTGNRIDNGIRQADAQVLSARETLRDTEQTVLNDAATAYMDVLRDTAILDLRRSNVEVLEEQVRQTRERFNVGEVTRTDVAQAESRLAAARSDVSAAEAQLKSSIGRFRQVIGTEPRQLGPGRPAERLTPASLEAALRVALIEHPAIAAALHNVDVALLQVKITEGELAPQVSVQGALTRRYDSQTSQTEATAASIVGRVTIPIYEGGEVYARVRSAKETLGQRRIEADQVRERVRATVFSAWGVLTAAKARILAAQAQVQAAEVALTGVREEAKVGQRTTLDVLNAQQELLNARSALVTAQRDRVVASYALVAATGRLSLRQLNLNVPSYDPAVHYWQVRDRWIGVRTPDGR